jgi:4-amino-4-deoxy-L-arabinose transferase-like glycosyltransferase
MDSRNRRRASICLVCALTLAIAGQYYFARRREFMWDGIVLYGLASALFLTAVSLAREAPLRRESSKPVWRSTLEWAGAHRYQALLGSLGALASLAVGRMAAGQMSPAQGYAALGLWLAGIGCYLAATVDRAAAWAWLRGLWARVRASRGEFALVLLLFVAAAALRLTALDRIPHILGGDEASMGREALNVLHGRLTNPFVTGWFSHPTLFFYLQAAALRWPGGTVVGLRFVPALAGALTVPALYLLARELFDRRMAFLAAAYLAFYHYAIHYSRLGLNNAVDPLLAVLAFYFLLLGLRKRCPLCSGLAGVLFGLGQYFYMGGRVVPIVLAAFLAWRAWREPGFWRTYRHLLLVLGGAFLVTAWPLLLFFARHPHDFMARMNQLGILQSGWLAREVELTQRSQASLLWEQFLKSALAFHYYPDRSVFYLPGTPLLDSASAVLFTFGLVYSLAHIHERRHCLLMLWYWGVIISGGMLLENPPNSQRLLLTTIPASVSVALGLSLTDDVAGRIYRWRRSSTWMVLAFALAALAVASVRFYFGPYTRSRVYPGLNTEVGHQLGLYLRQRGPGYRYYFFAPPRMYAGFPSIVYLAPEVEGEDVLEPLTGPPGFVEPDKLPLFVFLPERLAEIEYVEATYPKGRRLEFRQPAGSLLFVVYEPH